MTQCVCCDIWMEDTDIMFLTGIIYKYGNPAMCCSKCYNKVSYSKGLNYDTKNNSWNIWKNTWIIFLLLLKPRIIRAFFIFIINVIGVVMIRLIYEKKEDNEVKENKESVNGK